jgi:hypothetical protein
MSASELRSALIFIQFSKIHSNAGVDFPVFSPHSIVWLVVLVHDENSLRVPTQPHGVFPFHFLWGDMEPTQQRNNTECSSLLFLLRISSECA